MSRPACGTPESASPSPREQGLGQGGDHDPQRHGPHRLGRQPSRVLATLPGQAAEEPEHPPRGRLAGGVEDARHDHREHELDERGADPPRPGRDPACGALHVGLDPGEERLGAPGHSLPRRSDPLAHQRDVAEPVRGWGKPVGGEGVDELADPLGVVGDGGDADPGRDHEQGEQGEDHHGHRRTPAPPEPCLDRDQDGPGGDDDHRRPDHGRGEGQHHPDAGAGHRPQGQDTQGDAGEVVRRRRDVHGVSLEAGSAGP